MDMGEALLTGQYQNSFKIRVQERFIARNNQPPLFLWLAFDKWRTICDQPVRSACPL